jgi:uncharacterized protein YbjT (DUF2867 family)
VNVVLFGATGMIGGGVLTECLDDDGVASVVSVGRTPSGRRHPKLRDVVIPDLFDLGARADEIGGFDACLYCLGVSSAGMSEDAYRRVTLDLTVAVADVLERLEPDMTCCFISGAGSGSGRAMWARVKGEAERVLLDRAFTTYVFRPGFIRPVKGARSRTPLYRALYALLRPITPAVQAIAPNSMTSTDVLGRAMIRAASDGFAKRILETPDINALGA